MEVQIHSAPLVLHLSRPTSRYFSPYSDPCVLSSFSNRPGRWLSVTAICEAGGEVRAELLPA